MTHRSRLTFKVAILGPLALVCLVLVFIVAGYTKNLRDDLNAEYRNITDNIAHSVKLLSGMDYSFSVYFSGGNNLGWKQTKHSQKIGDNGLCEWFPTQREIQSAYRADARKVLRLDYAVIGHLDACDPKSDAYKDIDNKLVLAPTFSFLNGIEDYIAGLYFISPQDYWVVSPAHLVEKIDQQSLAIIKKREYWLEAKEGMSTIRLNGPTKDITTGRNILTISAGIFDNDQFNGVVVLDILMSHLYSEGSAIGERVKLVSLDKTPIPSNAWMPKTVWLDGVKTNQIMYFQWDWAHEFKAFIQKSMASLSMLLTLYICVVIGLVYRIITVEKNHFQHLSERDPLTSLLNRRGFEVVCYESESKKYEGLALFDIDDFKKINDTYGHDVGDDVICGVANSLKRNIRSNDVVARFGGEEFVLYMQGTNADKMIEAVQRIQKEIGHSSTKVIEQGYTVSAGFTVKLTSEKITLEQLIKEADDKLYTAKRTGKNQVVI